MPKKTHINFLQKESKSLRQLLGRTTIEDINLEYQNQVQKEMQKIQQLGIKKRKKEMLLIRRSMQRYKQEILQLAPLNKGFYRITLDETFKTFLSDAKVMKQIRIDIPERFDPRDIAKMRARIHNAYGAWCKERGISYVDALLGEDGYRPDGPIITWSYSSFYFYWSDPGEYYPFQYDIHGQGFGNDTGSIFIAKSPHDFYDRIETDIVEWRNDYVNFTLRQKVIGFDYTGNLYIKRADGLKDEWSNVTVNPLSHGYKATIKVVDQVGAKYLPFGFPDLDFHYQKDHTIFSPNLPTQYRPYEFYGGICGTRVWLSRNVVNEVAGINVDEYENWSFLTDPYIEHNPKRICAKIRVTNGWYWDYEITAEFLIEVPVGYDVSPEWAECW